MSTAVADITGKPRIIEGDTIQIGDTKIRLHGIDAPEMKQTCKLNGGNWFAGKDAKNAIASLLADKTLVCRGTG
jgi:endonuclease YncB( thermonuclease family)